mgnify:FL=1
MNGSRIEGIATALPARTLEFARASGYHRCAARARCWNPLVMIIRSIYGISVNTIMMSEEIHVQASNKNRVFDRWACPVQWL